MHARFLRLHAETLEAAFEKFKHSAGGIPDEIPSTPLAFLRRRFKIGIPKCVIVNGVWFHHRGGRKSL